MRPASSPVAPPCPKASSRRAGSSRHATRASGRSWPGSTMASSAASATSAPPIPCAEMAASASSTVVTTLARPASLANPTSPASRSASLAPSKAATTASPWTQACKVGCMSLGTRAKPFTWREPTTSMSSLHPGRGCRSGWPMPWNARLAPPTRIERVTLPLGVFDLGCRCSLLVFVSYCFL